MAEGGKSEEGVRQLKYAPSVPPCWVWRSSCDVLRQGPMYRRSRKATMLEERVRRKRRGRIVAA